MEHTLLTSKDWDAFPKRQFAAWFNQLEGLRTAHLVGTSSKEGVGNLAVFSSITHVGARPPLVGMVFRPLTVERHTYENIKEQGYYTLNHMSKHHLDALHQSSAKYPKQTDEFEALGLHKVESSFGVPYVEEAGISMLLSFKEEHHIQANDTIFMVGAVEELRIPKGASFGVEYIPWDMLDALVVSGLYDYYDVRHYKKKAYAKL